MWMILIAYKWTEDSDFDNWATPNRITTYFTSVEIAQNLLYVCIARRKYTDKIEKGDYLSKKAYLLNRSGNSNEIDCLRRRDKFSNWFIIWEFEWYYSQNVYQVINKFSYYSLKPEWSFIKVWIVIILKLKLWLLWNSLNVFFFYLLSLFKP